MIYPKPKNKEEKEFHRLAYETEKEDLIKQINVKVFYPYGSKLKNVEIGTVAENS